MSARKRKSSTNPGILLDAEIVVGIDIGTVSAGFAYAATANPEEVFTFYDWPARKEAVGRVYCKTQTSLWYLPGRSSDTFGLQDWGWPAQVNYVERLQNLIRRSYLDALGPHDRRPCLFREYYRDDRDAPPCSGHHLKKIRQHLDAARSTSGSTSADPKSNLPKGLTVQIIISDYLKELSILIMAELRKKFGPYIEKTDIKWCLTVPAMWTDAQTQTMKDCAEMAGLVCGHLCRDADASLREIVMVSELEAASVYCLQKLKDSCLRKGSKFLVVDAGGGTTDVVVYEKMDDSGVQVRKVRCSTGDGCDGAFMTTEFIKYLSHRISCYWKFSSEHPELTLKIKRDWENQITCNFEGQFLYTLEVPYKLAVAWETYQKENGLHTEGCQYDKLEISSEKILAMIFDKTVGGILYLIREQLQEVPEIQVIMVTGGFSNSPYLMRRIRNSFSSMVKQIFSPPDPGSAVCQGAVAFGLLGKDIE